MADKLFFSLTYDFLGRYLPKQIGRSNCTVESYRDALTVFRRFALQERGLPISKMTFGDCTRDFALSFVEHLRDSGCSAGTCNHSSLTGCHILCPHIRPATHGFCGYCGQAVRQTDACTPG